MNDRSLEHCYKIYQSRWYTCIKQNVSNYENTCKIQSWNNFTWLLSIEIPSQEMEEVHSNGCDWDPFDIQYKKLINQVMTCQHISIDHNKNLILCISPKWETNKKINFVFAYRRLITYRYDNLTREERSGMLPVRLQFLKLLKILKYKSCINLFLCNEIILNLRELTFHPCTWISPIPIKIIHYGLYWKLTKNLSIHL